MKRNSRFNYFLRLSIFSTAVLLSSCGWNDLAMGGGGDATETGNARVAGRLVFEDGTVAAGADVMIMDANYNPVQGQAIPDSQRVKSNANGGFQFAKLDSGRYNIQVKHSDSHKCLLILNVSVHGDTVRLAQDTLRISGTLSVPVPETVDSGVGYVFVPGTTLRSRIDSEIRITGKIRIDSVPPQVLPAIAYTKGEAGSEVKTIGRDIPVKSNGIAQVPPFSEWSHVAILKLPTHAGGVPITKDQYGFPLLVRLVAPLFDFSQAESGGQDIRFAKTDGTPLVREIEAWNPKAGHAEIWVHLDTVYAGAEGQTITMHWGNARVNPPKAHFSVFDSSRGFGGVWHLGEESAGITANGLYKDATGSGNNGDDRIANTRVQGAIAGGHGFDSSDYIYTPIASKTMANPNAFTLSVWFRSTGKLAGLGADMLSMGDNYGLRLNPDSALHLFFWPAAKPADLQTDWYEVDAPKSEYMDGAWHWAGGVFDGDSLIIYLDGLEAARKAVVGPVAYGFPLNMTMGKHGHAKKYFEFTGDLDEAQIHSVARSHDWMQLSYANQKPGSGFPEMVMP